MLTPTEKFIFSKSRKTYDESKHRVLVDSTSLHPISSHFQLSFQLFFFFTHMLTLLIRSDSFLFLFISMIIIATSLYLPSHISTMASRAFYYYAGEPLEGSETAGDVNANVGDMSKGDMTFSDTDSAPVIPLKS